MKKSRITALILALCMLTVAFAAPVAPAIIDGAQVRTEGVQGLRFTSSISLADFESDDLVEFGTVLVPANGLANDADLVIGANIGGYDVAKIPATNIYGIDGDVVTYTAVITKIATANYQRQYAARAYITYMEDGVEKTVYSDTATKRDVYTVAKAALADTDANLSDEAKAALQAVVNVVDGVKYYVTFVDVKENATVPYSIEVAGVDSASISWTTVGNKSFSGSTFASGTEYTATVTLTKADGFGPKDKVFINGNQRPVTRSADGKTLTAKRAFDLRDAGWGGIY